jgi:hypothetical protein
MTAHYEDGPVQVWHGDCIDVMRGMPDNSPSTPSSPTRPTASTSWARVGQLHRAELKTAHRLGSRQTVPESGTHSRGYADNDTHAFQAWCASGRPRHTGSSNPADTSSPSAAPAPSTASPPASKTPASKSATPSPGSTAPASPNPSTSAKRSTRCATTATTSSPSPPRSADAADRLGITRGDVDTHMGTSDMGGWWLSRLRHRCQCPKWDQWLRLKALLQLRGARR